MHDDIVIIRDGNIYRVVHGHLRLSSMLSECNRVCIGVKGEGIATITRTAAGLFIDIHEQVLPLSHL